MRYDVPEDQFWGMTLRQLARIIRVKSDMLKEQEKAQWTHTAVQVAYMMNMVGGAAAGRKWRQVSPKSLLDQWLPGAKPNSDFKERWKAALKSHEDRLRREAIRRAGKAN